MEEKQVVFIQVGSNEGRMSTDPLCNLIVKESWKGVLIEPVPHIFEKLKENYEGYPSLYFENVAVSDTRKICPFYILDPNSAFMQKNSDLTNEAGGPWGDLVGSFDKEHVLKHKPGICEEDLKVFHVQCVTLQDIIEKYQLAHVDVLHIDAEGHDEVILRSIDFTKVRPSIIIFEHIHIDPEHYFASLINMQVHGYSVLYTGARDTVMGLSFA